MNAESKSPEQLQRVLDAMPIEIIYVDSEQRYRYVNRAFEDRHGIQGSEVIGRTLEDVLGSSFYSQLREYVQEALSGNVMQFSISDSVEGGPTRYIRVSYIPEKDESGKTVGFFAMINNLDRRNRVDDSLRDIAQNVSVEVGESFFRSLVVRLAKAARVEFAFVAEVLPGRPDAVRTIAICDGERILENFEYDLADTPCENVIGKQLCSYPSRVTEIFPDDTLLKEMRIESYVGAPLFDSSGSALGLIGIMDKKALPDLPLLESIIQIIAVRAAAELERKRTNESMLVRTRQLAFVAELGQRALAGWDVGTLLEASAYQITVGLSVEYGSVMELMQDGRTLLLRAGIGWNEGLVGRLQLDAAGDSDAARALSSREPTVMTELNKDAGIAGTHFLLEHGVNSGISIPIQGKHQPYGTIGAYTRRRRKFQANDVLFLQGIANVLGSAIERNRVEDALKDSEKHLRTIIDSEPECVKLLARDSTLLAMNPAGLAMIEVESIEQVMGKAVIGIVTPEYQQAFKEMHEAVFRGESGVLEFDIIGMKGTRRSLESHSVPLRDGRGEIIAHLAVARDITERKKAEKSIKESEDKYRDLFENANDLIQSVAPDGTFRYVNRAWKEALGYTDEELGRLSIFDIIDPDCKDHCMENFGRIMAGEKLGRIEVIFIAKDGKKITLEGSANCRFVNGKPVSTRGIFRDISERKEMEEEILRSRKLDSLGILAGGIAHDFNNLLTAILGNVSLAKMYAGMDSRINERLSEAEKASMRARDLTQQLLSFAKGGSPVKKTTTIAGLIKDAANFALRGSKVHCKFHIAEDLWPVDVDEGQMSQVIHNLVINADQAMPEGGHISIRAENVTTGAEDEFPMKNGKKVRIIVEDRGIGIPETALPKIFDPYFTTKQKGSGLGLATAYAIIKKHDGYITATSQLGVGTTFYIYLSASQKSVEEQRDRDVAVISGRGRILFMDDDESVRDVAGQMMRDIGYELEFARDGVETIERYKKALHSGYPFDAVILDLTIPGGMGGKETVQKLRDIDPELKAIVSSGYSDDPIMADYAKHGFCNVISKPYKVSDLSKALHDVIGMRKG